MNQRSDSITKLNQIFEKAFHHTPLSKADIVHVLNLNLHEDIQALFKTASALKEKFFGNRIFLYGFLYFSTYCRNSCNFCLYRKNNSEAPRYRKTVAEIVESAKHLADSGVNLIDLTMGEDPLIFKPDGSGFDTLLQTIQSVKAATDLPIMISAGVMPEPVLEKLIDAGTTWYSCYQETHNRALYDKLRTEQDYDTRFNSKQKAKEIGLLIEEGLLTGIGDSSEDIADSIFAMQDLDADQMRVMTFIPQKGTPMMDVKSQGFSRELLITAVLRLIFPDRLIPASLDVGGETEMDLRLAAGANVITSLIPPGKGLAGVAQSALDIEDGKRTVAGIKNILLKNNLEAASSDRYDSWIHKRLERLKPVQPKTA